MIIQRTIDTYTGFYDFAVSGGAIGTIDLQVPIPNNTAYIQFFSVNVQTPTSGGAATISFDLLVNSIAVPVLLVGKFMAAGVLATFGVPNDIKFGTLPATATAPFKLVAAATIAMSIAVAPLTAGKLQFCVSCVSFDF